MYKSDWLTISNKAEDPTTVEIDIVGTIGGNTDWYGDDTNPESVNTKEKMRAELKALAELQAEKIIINIDSPGGSVAHGMSIHDLLAMHKAKKETRIIGMAASIATVIAQVGDVRKISDNALFLIHRSMNLAMGNVNDMQSAVEDLKAVDAKIINIYNKRGANPDKVNELMDANNGNGKWLDGKEAVEAGLLDEVFEPTKAAAVYDRNILNKLKLPIPEKMTENDVKTFSDKLDSFLEKVTNLFKREPEPEQEPAAKTELEISNAKVIELEGQLTALKTANDAEKAELETLKNSLVAKETEANNLITELQGLKNSWKPEGRQTPNHVDNIEKVKEILNKRK